MQARSPHQRHAVGQNQIRLGNQRAEAHVVAAAAEMIEIWSDDESAEARIKLIEDVIDRRCFVNRMELHAMQTNDRRLATAEVEVGCAPLYSGAEELLEGGAGFLAPREILNVVERRSR